MAQRSNLPISNPLLRGVLLACGLASVAATAEAAPRDQAYTMFNRLNGVPPSPAKLDEMEGLVAAGNLKEAAMAAIDDPAGMFLNLTIKSMVARWSNTDKSPRVPLNDYIATVIGLIRDDLPFTEVMSGNYVYTGNVVGAPAYSMANNDHYVFLENNTARVHEVLVKQTQTAVNGLPDAAIAGVLSTRGFGEAYYKAGTNRRAIQFTIDTFLCKDLENLMDTTRPDFRVRRDVTRAPGGDSALFRNRCAGCHAGMDAFGGAFAFYDWTDQNEMVYTAGQVRPKFNRNSTEFPDGFVTADDSWINNWVTGQNASVGWRGATSGTGARSFGEMMAQTDAFAQCMARRAWEVVCLNKPAGKDENAQVSTLAASFKADGYNMKSLFAGTAAVCVK